MRCILTCPTCDGARECRADGACDTADTAAACRYGLAECGNWPTGPYTILSLVSSICYVSSTAHLYSTLSLALILKYTNITISQSERTKRVTSLHFASNLVGVCQTHHTTLLALLECLTFESSPLNADSLPVWVFDQNVMLTAWSLCWRAESGFNGNRPSDKNCKMALIVDWWRSLKDHKLSQIKIVVLKSALYQ